jgi:hypothetical protein
MVYLKLLMVPIKVILTKITYMELALLSGMTVKFIKVISLNQ